MSARPAAPGVLVVGRGLHGPWNEGARLTGRNVARVAAASRPVQVLSLTQSAFRSQPEGDPPVTHVYTGASYSAPGDYAALPQMARQIARLLRQQPAGVAHLIGLPLALAPLLRRRGLRVVAHVTLTRHVYIGRVERLRAALGWRLFDRWIDAYACTSACLRDDLLRQGYPLAKVHVAQPPVDVDCFRPADRGAAREQLGLAQEEFLVAYIGSVSPLRFPAEAVLGGLRQAAATIPNLAISLFAPVGTHGYNHAWAEQNVNQAARDAGLPVRMHLRDLSEDEKRLVYSAADMCILPFSAPVAVEPPLTLLEAMACETAVAATPHANRSAVLEDGRNGFALGAPDDLGQALLRLHALDPASRTALRRAARQRIVEHYSFPAAARALQQIWRAVGLPD